MPRATLDEVLRFANEVRKAGGGDVIPALLSSQPGMPESCLIANALNFNCEVNCGVGDRWYMKLNNGDTAKKIAEALGLKREVSYFVTEPNKVFLPKEIGAVARDYDRAYDKLAQRTKPRGKAATLVIEMWPYIANVENEARRGEHKWVVQDGQVVKNPDYDADAYGY